MNWKTKALIQNVISLLPPELSYDIYFRLQRNFGTLKNFNPEGRLCSGISTAKFINTLGGKISNKVFFELGTGRAPVAPLALWLMGAEKVITADLNPYVKPELFLESVRYISSNKNKISNLFGDLLVIDRLTDLINFSSDKNLSFNKLMNFCSIDYLAPCDASSTQLDPGSIDYFISCAVLEHIDSETILKILAEGNRITKSDGMFINYIDYRDHFSTKDKNITAINFLQYSDEKWNKYAGNKYMYMNRLRHDDYIQIFELSGHQILKQTPTTDTRSLELLKSGDFVLDPKFLSKTIDILAIKDAVIGTGKKVKIPK
jgi:SAM-dependent methyltransferase